jgi:hypothetical protein
LTSVRGGADRYEAGDEGPV